MMLHRAAFYLGGARISRSDSASVGGAKFVAGQAPGRGEQVLSRPGTLQAMQGSLQSLLQQTPCEQKPVKHWSWAVAPVRDIDVALARVLAVANRAIDVSRADGHAIGGRPIAPVRTVSPRERNARPLSVTQHHPEGGVAITGGRAQNDPAGGWRQPPAPSHRPSTRQAVADENTVQAKESLLAGCPAGTGMHAPVKQVSHALVHATLQQTR